jgi:hypothetical protein
MDLIYGIIVIIKYINNNIDTRRAPWFNLGQPGATWGNLGQPVQQPDQLFHCEKNQRMDR